MDQDFDFPWKTNQKEHSIILATGNKWAYKKAPPPLISRRHSGSIVFILNLSHY